MPIALLHPWNPTEKAEKGLFQIGSDGRTIPDVWRLKPAGCEPEAFPTPFARAEATRLVLEKVETAHPLFNEFRWLVLGIAAGVLSLEPEDLSSPDYDNLGRALMQVDKDAQYFSRISFGPLLYGVTYRSCLAWGHARRQGQDGLGADWAKLAAAIKPLEKHALQVLADWRDSLRSRWSPPDFPWQRGIDELVGNTPVSPGREELAANASMVGPIWLDLPSGRTDVPPRAEPIYFPSYEPGFAARFRALLSVAPRKASGGNIEFRDGRETLVAQIRLPSGGHTGDSFASIALGAGRLDFVESGARVAPEGGKVYVEGTGGLLQLLEPLKLSLAQSGRPVAGAASTIDAAPYLYPDPIRLLLQFRRSVFDPPSKDGATVFLTHWAMGKINDARKSIPDAGDVKDSDGATALMIHGDTKTQVILLDRLGDVEIGDLRALGSVLWRVFIGEADVAPQLAGNIADEDLAALLHHSASRVLEPVPKVYERVVGNMPAEELSKRLATLQRFVHSYASSPDGVLKLLERAARSFADWANGGVHVHALGRKSKEAVIYRLPIGVELPIAKDSVGAGRATST